MMGVYIYVSGLVWRESLEGLVQCHSKAEDSLKTSLGPLGQCLIEF